jgi:transcriptional regulator with XRE-family HTH domain
MESNFGKNLRSNRQERRYSQCVVAEKIGCTQQCVSGWENCKIEPTMSYLWKLADVFEISIDKLVGRKEY